jgi:pimeloyl-ACP methyl ester carboxylesterase
VDIIGQPNRSAETRLPLKGDDYGRWLDQVMDGLGLEKAPFIGVSYGAFIFQKFIAYRPDRIQAAIFVVPGGFGDGSPFKSVFNVLIPMWRYLRSRKEEDLLKFMDAFYSTTDAFSVAYQKAVLHGVKMDLRRPPIFTGKQGRGLQAPVFLLAVRDDIFFPGAKAEKLCRKVFRNFREAVFLEGAKHIPAPREFPEIAGRIDAWLDYSAGSRE